MYLTTERLLIRNLVLKDVSDLYRLLEDPVVMEYSSTGPLSGEQASSFIQSKLLPNSKDLSCGIWGIQLREKEEVIGLAGLSFQKVDKDSLLEVGYRLHPDHWGRGYATEAAKALLSYAWKNHKVDRVISIIDESNIRSASVAERLGMHRGWGTTYEGFPVIIYQVHRGQASAFDALKIL